MSQELVSQLARAIRATHRNRYTDGEVYARAHQLAETDAFAIVGGRLRPAGSMHKSAAAAQIDAATVRNVAREAYPSIPAEHQLHEGDRMRQMVRRLEGMGIDPTTFGWAQAPGSTMRGHKPDGVE